MSTFNNLFNTAPCHSASRVASPHGGGAGLVLAVHVPVGLLLSLYLHNPLHQYQEKGLFCTSSPPLSYFGLAWLGLWSEVSRIVGYNDGGSERGVIISLGYFLPP